EVKGILVYGIDPEEEKQNSDWNKYIVEGNLPAEENNSIVVGYELARKSGLGVGDEVQLITGIGVMQTLTITGIFQANFYEIDVRVGLINIAKAQEIYGLSDSVNFLSVKLEDPFLADGISTEMGKSFFAYNIRS